VVAAEPRQASSPNYLDRPTTHVVDNGEEVRNRQRNVAASQTKVSGVQCDGGCTAVAHLALSIDAQVAPPVTQGAYSLAGVVDILVVAPGELAGAQHRLHLVVVLVPVVVTLDVRRADAELHVRVPQRVQAAACARSAPEIERNAWLCDFTIDERARSTVVGQVQSPSQSTQLTVNIIINSPASRQPCVSQW
jgi:hypothetical protein